MLCWYSTQSDYSRRNLRFLRDSHMWYEWFLRDSHMWYKWFLRDSYMWCEWFLRESHMWYEWFLKDSHMWYEWFLRESHMYCNMTKWLRPQNCSHCFGRIWKFTVFADLHCFVGESVRKLLLNQRNQWASRFFCIAKIVQNSENNSLWCGLNHFVQ
jgi:hypothetical protein